MPNSVKHCTSDSLGNRLHLEDPASLAAVNDFVEGFIACEARAVNILRLAESDQSAIVQAYCAALHMFAEAPDGPGNARPFIENALRHGAGAGRPGRDGLFVYAQGGTLFLDEIGELPAAQQATLLRVLEERRIRPLGSEQEIPVDVRIVAATHRRLADEVAAGRFRKDLYYRLQVVEINLPPLRAHKDDIAELVAHFIDTLAPRLGVPRIEVSEDELRFLCQYDWPGNVRELRNLIERSLILGALNVSALYQSLPRPPVEPRARSGAGT